MPLTILHSDSVVCFSGQKPHRQVGHTVFAQKDTVTKVFGVYACQKESIFASWIFMALLEP